MIYVLLLILLFALCDSNIAERVTYQHELDETLPPKGTSGRRYVSGFT